MPIISKNDITSVEYTIPEEIEEKIPERFYFAMAGELCSIYGPQIFEKIEWVEYNEDGNELIETRNPELDYYDLDSTSGGWYEAFCFTCNKLDMKWLLDYYKTLEWYDGDIFDGIIEGHIIKKFIENKPSSCNPYYKYLVEQNKE